MRRIAVALCLLSALPVLAESAGDRAARQFSHPDLAIKTRSVALDEARAQVPNAAAWDALVGRYGGEIGVFLDARSGTPSSVVGGIPLLPGTGRTNRVSLDEVGRRLGRAVPSVDETVVRDVVRAFVREHEDAFGIDLDQLGAGRASEVRPGFWQVSLPQEHRGVPVRYGRVLATIKNGNLLVFGTETWGPVALDATPSVSPNAALDAAFEAIGGRSAADELLDARLEIVPTEGDDPATGQVLAGGGARGYAHRLVWSFRFQRGDEVAVWETLVDAHSREVLSFQDVSESIRRPLTGRVFSPTNTEACPTLSSCGLTQAAPMPFADTGLAPPFQATNSAGLFVDSGLPVTTTLAGPYVRIKDMCGPVLQTAQGTALDLGGTSSQHDCETPPGASAGNTSSSRSAFYEVNKLMEMARGWLPDMPFLHQPMLTRVNVADTCNAKFNPVQNSLNFFQGGGGCRNTGEIATIVGHEWGHALDFNDVSGSSNTSEGFADVAAIYRQGVSCIGHGMWETLDKGCGATSDGVGFNAEESDGGPGAPHCALDCSGVRDADWARHAHQSPDTPQNFVCGSCLSGFGPCGRAVHCSGAPIRQAAWDLVARDLQAGPFDLDFNSALILGNKLFYEGSGNVGNWYECDCGQGTSGGCGGGSGYMQWLAADDDNGSLFDGTPHLTAIRGAFARHNIACPLPQGGNGGCASRPTQAPQVTLKIGSNHVSLAWTAVPNAREYWVFRSEGRDACRLGKTRIARVSGLSHTDGQVGNDRSYCYSVTAVGATDECLGPASSCACRTPQELSLSCGETGPVVPAGTHGQRRCRITAGEGANGRATFTCSGLPDKVLCSFSPNPASPLPDTFQDVDVDLFVGATAAGGTFAGKVVATYDSGVVRTAPLSVDVAATPPSATFELACPQTVTVGPGTAGTFECRVQSIGGFAKPVSLGCGGGSGVSCTMHPATVTPPHDGSAPARLRVEVAPGTPDGVRSATVVGTHQGIVRHAAVEVVVVTTE